MADRDLDKELRALARLGNQRSKFEGKDYYLDYLRTALGDKALSVEEVVLLGVASELLGAGVEPTGSRGADWSEMGGASYLALTRAERLVMYQRARRFCRAESLGMRLLQLLGVYVMGRGFKVTLRSVVAGSKHPLQDRFDAYFGQDYANFYRQAVFQTLKHGSMYAIHLPLIPPGGMGYPRLRLVVPDHLVDEEVGDGFAVNPEPIRYCFDCLGAELRRSKIDSDGWIPAGNVTELHVLRDFNDGRHGLSVFYWLFREAPRLVDFLAQRDQAQRMENLSLVIRYLKGMAGGTFREGPLKSGVLDANAEIEEYKPLQLTSKARDTQADGDEIRNRLAQSQPFPEPIFTQNPRYAAQVGNLGFPNQALEGLQDELVPGIRLMTARRLGCDPSDVLVSMPLVDTRDRSRLISELTGLVGGGHISRAEVHRRGGYDHELNEAEIAEEKKKLVAAASATAATLTPSMPGAITPARTVGLGPSSPVAEITLPQLQSSARIPYSAVPVESVSGPLAAGVDPGFSAGAIVVGGLDESDNLVVLGEVSTKDLPTRGEMSWQSTLKRVKNLVPRLELLIVGKDDPDLARACEELGFTVVCAQESSDATEARLAQFVDEGHEIHVYEQARQLLSVMDPERRDAALGTHMGDELHHWSAFRYLSIGLLERYYKRAEKPAGEVSEKLKPMGEPVHGSFLNVFWRRGRGR